MDLVLVNIDYQNVVGVFTMAAYLRSKGFSVKILDGPVESVEKRLYELKDKLSIVGFTATTCSIKKAAQACWFVKTNISRSILCIIGGFHASALPEETLRDYDFDIAVIGEGEITLEEILSAQKDKASRPFRIRGTVERCEGEVLFNESRELIQNLDLLPVPAYDLVDFDYYARGGLGLEFKHCYSMTLLLSRGCPFDCVFCCSKNIWKGKVRTYSAEYALDLIEQLIKRYGVSFINFLDDDFFAKKSFFIPFVEGFIRRGFHRKIRWSCQSTSRNSSLENLRLAKQSGCKLVRYGFESFDESILHFIKGPLIKVADHHKAIENCIKTDMPFFGSLIVGSPMETVESIMVNIQTILKYPFRMADMCLLTPMPGTRLWALALQCGIAHNHMDWDTLNTDYAYLKYDHFTNVQMPMIRFYITNAITYPMHVGRKPLPLDHEANIRRIMKDDFSVIPQRQRPPLGKIMVGLTKSLLSPPRIRSIIKRKLLGQEAVS